MNRFLFLLLLLLLSPGCFRDTAPNEPRAVPHAGYEVIITDLEGSEAKFVDWHGYRVGGYYDFSTYDSLAITFVAHGVPGGASVIPLSVKIGPGYYAFFKVAGEQQQFTYGVPVRFLVKPHLAALVFSVQDTVSSVLLSDLTVGGWYTN